MRSTARVSSHPIHPMLVMFPFGLWTTSFIFDVLGRVFDNSNLFAAGFYVLVAGCVGALLAAIPGAIDLFTVVPPNSSARQRGYIHGSMNVVALLLFIFIAWRRGSAQVVPDNISLLLSFIGIAGICVSGWLGGTLVYRNQIGIDRRYANAKSVLERNVEEGRPIANVSEIGPGQMMLAKVGAKAERIALGKCSDGVHAFQDRCTHKGGPLSDGALIDCKVQCPWHGSQFDITTGRVVAGPAERQIQTFATEERSGEIYLPEKKDETKKAA
ncbi:MAG: DUF2231 domain-containing protein [Terriglobales bacterium]|jgi:uncharacterized membrane protein/nitrite reductase/ring-hydroxylating ferredoxin subunit